MKKMNKIAKINHNKIKIVQNSFRNIYNKKVKTIQ